MLRDLWKQRGGWLTSLGLACLVLTGLGLAAWPAGCGGHKRPPEPEVRPAQGYAIPAPLTLENPAIFIYGRLRDPATLADRFSRWAGDLGLFANPRNLKNMLLGADDFRPGENAGLYLFDPGANLLDPPLAGVFPLPFDSRGAALLSRLMGGNNITSIGTNTVIANNRSGLTRAIELADTVGALNHAPLPADAQLYLNLDAIVARYGPLLRPQIQVLQGLLSMRAGGSGTGLWVNPRLLQAQSQALFDFLDQTKYLNLSATLTTDALELGALVKAKPETTLAGFLAGGPLDTPDLTLYMRPEAFLKAQQAYEHPRRLADLYMKYLSIALGPGHEKDLERMRTDMKELDKIGRMHVGTSLSIDPGGPWVYESVIYCDNALALEGLVRRKTLDWLNAGPLHDLYASMGIQFSVKEDPNLRRLRGWEVHRYNLNIAFAPTMAPDQRARLEKLFGNLVMEECRIGRLVLVSMNQPIDQLLDRVYARPEGNSASVMQLFPAGGTFYLDFNPAVLASQLKASLPSDEAAQIPDLNPSAPPISVAGYHAQAMGYYRVRLPKFLIRSLMSAHPENYRPGRRLRRPQPGSATATPSKPATPSTRTKPEVIRKPSTRMTPTILYEATPAPTRTPKAAHTPQITPTPQAAQTARPTPTPAVPVLTPVAGLKTTPTPAVTVK